MSDADPALWRLPDGVDELLPPVAARVESLRRRVLDLSRASGFELVSPPLIEYLDALLTGTGEPMGLQTFKLVDQRDGRALGVRADMTAQVARIDAHALLTDGPSRLCYGGTVLRARVEGIGASRNPRQFGAELFGHEGVESDVEICRLMLDTVALAGLDPASLTLDLGHVGVYAGLVRASGLDGSVTRALFEAMVRGSRPDVARTLERAGADEAVVERFARLARASGGPSVVAEARDAFAGIDARVDASLETLERVIGALGTSHPEVAVHVDLAELRGYRYHTGMLFAVLDGAGERLARGGRYDSVGRAFGRDRAATGFSGDLERLAAAEARAAAARDRASPSADRGAGEPLVLLREPEAPGAREAAARQRATGTRVVPALPGAPPPAGLTHELVRDGGGWTVRPLPPRTDDHSSRIEDRG